MTRLPRIFAALLSTALAFAVLWTHHTTTGLIVASAFGLAAIYAADPSVIDGVRKEASEAWAAYKNPQPPAP